MANVAFVDVWKKFGPTQALGGVDFETKEGELFCLLGPSGAGKTTTLRIIAGIENPDRGDVRFGGKSVVDLMPRERDVALAFESYALYPQLTVYDNLAFPLQAPVRKKDYPKAEIDKQVKEVADLLSIRELLQRYPRELSGGQRQRVGLGRALIRKPKIYLLDEPIAHLDAKLRHRMRGELKRIQNDLGITTIYSTPDQLEALSIADTIAVINKGKIEQVGPPGQIYQSPINVFVAKLVGDPPMNILAAVVSDGKLIVDCDDCFQFPIPENAPPALFEQKDNKVLIGIRPKDIEYVTDSSTANHTRGKAREVDILGQTSVAMVNVGNLELKVKVATVNAPARNDPVNLALDTSKLHYFDVETHKALPGR